MSKQVKVEGRVITVPDDATPDEIDGIVNPKGANPSDSIPKAKAPIPEGLKDVPIGQRMMNGFKNVVQNPSGLGMPMRQPTTKPGEPLGPTPEKLTDEVSNFARPFLHPIDAMTEDPIGTSLFAAQMGKNLTPEVASSTMKGAARGAASGMGEAANRGIFARSGLGYVAGRLVGQPEVGAAIGASVPVIKGAFNGAREGFNDYLGSRPMKGMKPGNESPADPTYTDAPLTGYRSDVNNQKSGSPKLPSWMSENVEPISPDPGHSSYKDIKNQPADNGFNGEGMKQIEPEATDFAAQKPKLPSSNGPLKGKKYGSKAYKDVKKSNDIVPATPGQVPPGNAQPAPSESAAAAGNQVLPPNGNAPQPVTSGSYRMIFDENGQPLAYDDPMNPDPNASEVTGNRSVPFTDQNQLFKPNTAPEDASPGLREKLGLRRYDEEFPTPSKQVIPKKKRK